MTDTLKKELALIVWTARDNGYFHIHAAFGYVTAANYHKPEWISSLDEPLKGRRFEHLRIRSQGTEADCPRRLYAWDLEYRDLYSVDRWDAQAMHQTFMQVFRHLEKIKDRQGRPETFGQYVGQIAQAAKVKHFFIWDQGTPNYRPTGSIGELVAQVNHLEYRWKQEGAKPQEVSV